MTDQKAGLPKDGPLNYTSITVFEWDTAKSNRCLSERGFDFAYASQVFRDEHSLVYPDERFEYGEKRYQIIGLISHRLFVVVFTTRNQRIRIISARKANIRERRLYEDHQTYH